MPKSLSFLFLSSIFLLSGCANRYYTLEKFSTVNLQSIVSGKVVNATDGLALPGVTILNTTDSSRISTDRYGLYKMKVNTKLARFKIISIGYYHKTIKKISVNPSDSIVLNMRMKEDNRPLVD